MPSLLLQRRPVQSLVVVLLLMVDLSSSSPTTVSSSSSSATWLTNLRRPLTVRPQKALGRTTTTKTLLGHVRGGDAPQSQMNDCTFPPKQPQPHQTDLLLRGGSDVSVDDEDRLERLFAASAATFNSWMDDNPVVSDLAKIALGIAILSIPARLTRAPVPSSSSPAPSSSSSSNTPRSSSSSSPPTSPRTTPPPPPPSSSYPLLSRVAIPVSVVSSPPPPATPGILTTRSATSLVTDASQKGSGNSSNDPPPPGTASMQDQIFNLVKGIVGVGVLSLPAGIASFGDSPSAAIPAVVLIAIIGALSGTGFSWIAEVCAATGATNFKQAWSAAVSVETSWIPAVSATAMTFAACLAFSMVLGDSVTTLLPAVESRTVVLWAVSAIVLAPLCWMKNLKSLAPFSMLGVLGMIYTAMAMTWRLVHGSYDLGSPLLRQIPRALHPTFGKEGWQSVFSANSIILVSMLSTAYMCHYNAPKFYLELKENTVPRFRRVVAAGFGLSVILTAWIAAVGFGTFGGASNGLILNNYSPNDGWMSFSRVAVAVSLTFSYPLAFQGLRDGVLDLVGVPAYPYRTETHLNVATAGLLILLTTLATVLHDVSFVLSLAGATLGNMLCYVYPAILYGRTYPEALVPALIVGGTGVVLGTIGVNLALRK